MTTTQNTPRHSLNWFRQEMDATRRHLAGLESLMVTAKACNLHSYISRIAEEIAEFDAELDEVVERAIVAGYGPEDFDA